MKQAIKKKKSIIFIYWIIPIVTLIIAGIMLKDKYETKGKHITIILNNVNGLNIQKSPVMFNGVKVGNIDDIKIDENNLNHFKAYLVMYKKYDYLIKKGTRFWKVSPEISLSKGIKNLGTIITGSYIEILPPKTDKKELMKLPEKYHFTALDTPPLNGITTTIKSKKASFGIGTMLVYKGIQVGEIIDKELKNDYIYYKVLIYNKYRDVLASDTKFIPLKPLEFQASLKGIKLTIPSLKNLVTGAIKIETTKKDNKPKKEYSFFIPKKIIEGYNFTLISDEKLPSMLVYKGFNVGVLLSSQLVNNKIYNHFKIYKKYQNLINNSTLFYKLNAVELKASLDKFSLQIPDIKSAVLGGVSFITPMKENLTKKEFKIFKSKSALDEYLYEKDSKKITILSQKVVKKGTLITYKTLNAGKVVNCKYNPQKEIIEITAFIKKPFIKLINKTTKFYTNSGINIKAGLDGIKIQTPTLDSVINGSISFVTNKNRGDSTKTFKLLNYNDLSKNNYFTINLTMSKTNGLKKGSILEYNGFTLGKVQNLIFDKNITAIIKIDKHYKYLFGKNSKLYLETFQAGLSGIKNPDSIIFGSKVVLFADKNDGFKSHFVIDSINPITSHYQKGLRVVLTAPSKAGLNINSPVYYRKVKIGHIEKIKLSKTAQNVEIFIFIKPKYENIIRTNSKFFNTGVLAIKANLLGIKIKTGTLESMIKGGIEVITPNNPGQKVTNGAIFKLYDKPKEEWFEYKPKLILNS